MFLSERLIVFSFEERHFIWLHRTSAAVLLLTSSTELYIGEVGIIMNLYCADSPQAQLVLLELAKWRKKKTCSWKAAAAKSVCRSGRKDIVI